jgi:hypothetical protein
MICGGKLELPRDGGWVRCDLDAGHVGKHSGALAGQRYWWAAPYARVRNLVRRRP